VKFAQRSFFAGEAFLDIADAQRRADDWCRVRAGMRVHGTTRRQPAVVFAECEAPLVHPFDDGNGRVARVMMNAELASGGQSRIIIPTVFRDDYLGGLRQLTRRGDSSVLIKALRYGHDYTARIDFSTLSRATEMLHETNAFNEPGSSERLRLPDASHWSQAGRSVLLCHARWSMTVLANIAVELGKQLACAAFPDDSRGREENWLAGMEGWARVPADDC
jgi:hypothetical protein